MRVIFTRLRIKREGCRIPAVLEVKNEIPDRVTSMACDHHENEQVEEELAKIPDEMVGAVVVHGPCTITVRADPADTNAEAKLQAVTDALSLV